jgi:hypothetical protein
MAINGTPSQRFSIPGNVSSTSHVITVGTTLNESFGVGILDTGFQFRRYKGHRSHSRSISIVGRVKAKDTFGYRQDIMG